MEDQQRPGFEPVSYPATKGTKSPGTKMPRSLAAAWVSAGSPGPQGGSSAVYVFGLAEVSPPWRTSSCAPAVGRRDPRGPTHRLRRRDPVVLLKGPTDSGAQPPHCGGGSSGRRREPPSRALGWGSLGAVNFPRTSDMSTPRDTEPAGRDGLPPDCRRAFPGRRGLQRPVTPHRSAMSRPPARARDGGRRHALQPPPGAPRLARSRSRRRGGISPTAGRLSIPPRACPSSRD